MSDHKSANNVRFRSRPGRSLAPCYTRVPRPVSSLTLDVVRLQVSKVEGALVPKVAPWVSRGQDQNIGKSESERAQ